MPVILNPFTGELVLTGRSGDTVTQIVPFTYQTTSLLLQAVTSAMTLLRAVVVISTPFDGSVQISLGVTADPSLVLSSSDVYADVAGQYESDLLVPMPSDFLQLHVLAPGSTQGAGTLLYTIGR